ncbi:MAG TPA: glycosyltransferase [Steroidobacteraceae bacterium]|nr:glycosyltransferase [Steroidobacteraceae bacterium]
MKLVIFGLTLSSSWGNGHATLWRGLIRALTRRSHDVVFFERDVPWYAEHRDTAELPGATLILYPEWPRIAQRARTEARQADVTVVTSYCPDAKAAAALVRDDAAGGVSVFYDLDTPVTLARLEAGETVDYLPEDGLGSFDLVWSYTGGAARRALRDRLGARRVAALYGHVDPEAHRPAPREERFRADLSYLGTYAPDRQPALETLFVEPARRRPGQRFVLGGSGYPPDFPWAGNIWFVRHVAPPEHPPFYSSSRLTLNVTRRDMAAMGFCPSGRLFEAAACATPVLSDAWEGIERFFTPGEEILLAGSSEEATAAIDLPPEELARIGRAARERTLDEHTSDCRAAEMLSLMDDAASRAV